MGVNMKDVTCLETWKLHKLVKLSGQPDKDSKQVAKLTKKWGLGTPEWQQAMLKRIDKKFKELKEKNKIYLEKDFGWMT